MAWLAARFGRARGHVAAAGLLALATAHTLLIDAPVYEAGDSVTLQAIVAVALVTAAAAMVARLYQGRPAVYREAVGGLALAGLAYLAPVALDGVAVVGAWRRSPWHSPPSPGQALGPIRTRRCRSSR